MSTGSAAAATAARVVKMTAESFIVVVMEVDWVNGLMTLIEDSMA